MVGTYRRLVCVATAVCVASVVLVLPGEVEAGLSHDPISIEGNRGLTAANGVTGGTGTETDPYVIEGWEIDASATTGVYIRSTSAYLVIRNVVVWGSSTQSDGDHGIVLERVSNVVIESMDVSGCFMGISIWNSRNVVVEGCTVHDNGFGIYLRGSVDITIRGNTLFANSRLGMSVSGSTRCAVVENQSTSNRLGLVLGQSSNIMVRSNVFSQDGILIEGKRLGDFNSHEIATDNLVNGLPVHYYVGAVGLSLEYLSAGELILVGCENVVVKGIVFSGCSMGAEIAFSKGVEIADCSFQGNLEGVRVVNSFLVPIRSCTFSGNYFGVVVEESHLLGVLQCQFNGNDMALVSYRSGELLVDSCTLVGNRVGLMISLCKDVVVSGSLVSAGELGILLVDCTRILVCWNEFSYHSNEFGFGVGMEIFGGNKIMIERNNFLDNQVQALVYELAHVSWDDGCSLSNYWSDYEGLDADGDGIGDTPYVIDANNQDNFPVMIPYTR